jgi:hypothetical protein
MMNVANNPNDRPPWVIHTSQLHTLANGVIMRPKHFCRRLVNQNDLRSAIGVSR